MMLHRLCARLRRPFLIAMAIGAALIADASLVYFDDEDLPAFVIEKLPLPLEDVWFWALRIHVVAAVLSLPACLLLLSKRLLRRLPRAHRYLGRAAGVVVLCGLVPSGLYLSWFAKGGLMSTVGFALSGAIVAVSMVAAVRAARTRNFARHARFTRHVVAQMSVAVISRAMMIALDALDVAPNLAYLVSLWLPVLAATAFVEWFSLPMRPHTQPKPNRSAHVSHASTDRVHSDLHALRGAARL